MGVAMVPVLPGRPSVVWVGGCAVYLSVRDLAHLAHERAFRRAIRQAHPDHGGSGAALMQLVRDLKAWRLQEVETYAALGVAPPPGSKARLPPGRDAWAPARRLCHPMVVATCGACGRQFAAYRQGGGKVRKHCGGHGCPSKNVRRARHKTGEA